MELRKKGDKIGELRAPIEEKDRTIAALQEQVKAHGAEIDTLKHQMRVVLQNQSLVSVREAVAPPRRNHATEASTIRMR